MMIDLIEMIMYLFKKNKIWLNIRDILFANHNKSLMWHFNCCGFFYTLLYKEKYISKWYRLSCLCCSRLIKTKPVMCLLVSCVRFYQKCVYCTFIVPLEVEWWRIHGKQHVNANNINTLQQNTRDVYCQQKALNLILTWSI